MEQELRDLVARFPERSVLVVGDVILDEYIWGEVQRISPEAPVPIVAVRSRSCAPGGAANAAVNVAGLGGRVLLAGVVGGDPPGARLRETLEGRGLAITGLFVDRERTTTTKIRIIAHHQHVVRVDEEQRVPLTPDLEDQLLHWVEEQMPSAHACILSDYGKGVVSGRVAERFIGLARQAGRPVVVDPKGTDFLKYRGATLVKPNLPEAQLACRPPTTGDLPSVSRNLLDLLKGSALLVTCGAEGMSLFEPGAVPYAIPSMAREVFDVTGAGDTVAGTLALALAAGATLRQAATLANHAAGIVVGKVGTAQATQDELLAALRP